MLKCCYAWLAVVFPITGCKNSHRHQYSLRSVRPWTDGQAEWFIIIVQLRRLTFLNGLCGSLNEVICRCYSWYRRGKNFTKLCLCNEYNIVGSSPLIFDVFAKFRTVCEGWSSFFLGHCSVYLFVSLYFILCFYVCLPEWWINVCINTKTVTHFGAILARYT